MPNKEVLLNSYNSKNFMPNKEVLLNSYNSKNFMPNKEVLLNYAIILCMLQFSFKNMITKIWCEDVKKMS